MLSNRDKIKLKFIFEIYMWCKTQQREDRLTLQIKSTKSTTQVTTTTTNTTMMRNGNNNRPLY